MKNIAGSHLPVILAKRNTSFHLPADLLDNNTLKEDDIQHE